MFVTLTVLFVFVCLFGLRAVSTAGTTSMPKGKSTAFKTVMPNDGVSKQVKIPTPIVDRTETPKQRISEEDLYPLYEDVSTDAYVRDLLAGNGRVVRHADPNGAIVFCADLSGADHPLDVLERSPNNNQLIKKDDDGRWTLEVDGKKNRWSLTQGSGDMTIRIKPSSKRTDKAIILILKGSPRFKLEVEQPDDKSANAEEDSTNPPHPKPIVIVLCLDGGAPRIVAKDVELYLIGDENARAKIVRGTAYVFGCARITGEDSTIVLYEEAVSGRRAMRCWIEACDHSQVMVGINCKVALYDFASAFGVDIDGRSYKAG